MLYEFDRLPEGFLDCSPAQLCQLLPGPALIHLPGRRPEPLFVSILLHGNEGTGLEAAQLLLKKYADQPLPRALSLFVGNIEAARQGLRRLEGQPDYNRVWPGSPDQGTAEHEMMRDIVNIMAQRKVFASIDLHNNTGLNPHYACINLLEHRFLHLARLFSRVVVYFTQPEGVQSAAFASLCPSVTVECGKPGVMSGAQHAMEFVEAALHLSDFPVHAVPASDVDLFHTVATVKVPDEIAFSVGGDDTSLAFVSDIDHLNFRELPVGTLLGKYRNDSGVPLTASSNDHQDMADRYFELRKGELLTRRPLMPAMLTRDERVIRQDCLCYLMERIDMGQVRL